MYYSGFLVVTDYMKTPPYLVTSPTKSVKSVRFSLSPSQNQRKSSSKARTKYPSDTSSDDDEVGFVQQFPCVEKPGRLVTTHVSG